MAITSIKSTRDFARIWFFWKIPAILIFCLIVISICFYSFTQIPMYESTTKILVLPKTNDESVISPGQDSRQFLSRPVSAEDINTEIQLIKSDVVIKSTVAYFQKSDSTKNQVSEKQKTIDFFKWFDLKQKPLTEAEKKAKVLLSALTVDPVSASNIISVSLESPYQDQVAEVLNQVMEIYLKYRKKSFSVGDTEIFYKGQKDYYKKELEAATKKLESFKNRWNIVNMNSQTDADLQLITEFQKELKNLEILIDQNQAKIDMLKNGLAINEDKFTLSKEMRDMPVIVELARGLVPLLIKRTEISKTFTKQSREYKQIDDQIAMLRQEIKKEGVSAARTDKMENQSLIVRKNLILKKMDDFKKASSEFQQKKEEHIALQMNVEIARNNFLKYGEKTEDSKMFTQRDESNLSNVVIVETASTPSRPKSPNKMLALQVSVFLGLFAAIIFPFILETLDHKLKTADDVENILSLPVVCSYNEL